MSNNKPIYSIQDKRSNLLIMHFWEGDINLYLSWTMDTQHAARWCGDCKQAAYDNLPDNLRQHCMIVVNKPFRDGWDYLCRTCDQKMEEIS
ncbi:hypothetical protein KAR91_07095 [Candidatus Pacearchaeota archaeon]|nr:hypothetical protein [Candidatus Pacearchaeota archaeon]